MSNHYSIFRQIVVLLALTALPVCAWGEDYGITVSGVAVNSDNAGAVTGAGIEGAVSYDVATNTLTLADATVRDIVSNRDGLAIQLEGSNRVWLLPASWSEADVAQGAVQCAGDLTIGGSGSLQVFHARFPDAGDGDKTCAIAVTGGSLTIEGGCLVEAYSPRGVGVVVDGDLAVRGSRLQAGGAFAMGIEAREIQLDGCVLHTPAASAVAVAGPEAYKPGGTSLMLTDIPVTAYNAHAFQSPYREKGGADYDPDTNVLTLDGFQTLNDEDGLIQSVRPLAFSRLGLRLMGASAIRQNEGLVQGATLAVDGDGELQLGGAQLSLRLDKLTLDGGCTFRVANAPQGYVHIDSLVVNASTYIESEIAEQEIGYYELNNSRVVAPAWLTYDAALHLLVPIEGRDTSGYSSLHIAPVTDATAVTDIDAAPERGDGVYYNLLGQPVTDPAPGIYVRNGKKVLVK